MSSNKHFTCSKNMVLALIIPYTQVKPKKLRFTKNLAFENNGMNVRKTVLRKTVCIKNNQMKF